MSTATERRTYDVTEAARLAGVSPWKAGEEIRSTGALAGVPVIRIGRRILIPRAAFDRVLNGEPVHTDYPDEAA